MATGKTLELREIQPREGENIAPFHYYDGNREARRHPELHPQVRAFKRQQYEAGLL